MQFALWRSLFWFGLCVGGDMTRKHWTHRMPRTAAKWALVAILVPFFLVGCVSLDKARQLFDTASQVCEIVDGVRQCLQN
ncbi:hypothetical protein ACQCZM_29715 [Escherichia coli]|uniref:hypothetical protein n=3 Tax=Enterobacteriaceae TaxID=543 RepID=UPI003CEEA2F0